MKTPLRRAVETLLEFIPDDCGELCSPFLGGASLELVLADRGVKVHGYDGFKPIVWFWEALLKDPARLSAMADSFRETKTYKYKKPRSEQVQKIRAKGLRKVDFIRFRDEIRYALRQSYPFSFEAAAKVYAINRSSFSGATFSGGFSERASYARFTDAQVEYIRNFKIENLTVKYADFKDSMKKHDCFLYLDPPYFLDGARSKLYGDEGDLHEFFPHLALFSILRQRDNWVLSYNNCAEIRHLYKDYQIHEVAWTYGMNKSKKSSEIVITNLPKRMHHVAIDLKGDTDGKES